jgi:hypothetical protein
MKQGGLINEQTPNDARVRIAAQTPQKRKLTRHNTDNEGDPS